MSGLLRRIKRSRAADAGQPVEEGRAVAPEVAPTTAEPASQAAGADPFLAPEGSPAAEPAGVNPSFTPDGSPAAEPAGANPFLTPDASAASTPGEASVGAGEAATAPLPLVPAGPAGLDPAEAALRPPAGRRGRLRRRLRFLRRARELMLRDLGGLLYEIHRSSGGDIAVHGDVIAAKVARLTQLDAESHALEAALGAPRGETIVFQPGVGGTCTTCGELHSSAAQYCSNCGMPIGTAPIAAPAPAPDREPVPAMPAAPAGEAPTSVTTDRQPAPSLGLARSSAPTRAITLGDPLGAHPASTPRPAEPAAAAPGAEPEAAAQPELRAPAPEPEPAVSAPVADPAPAVLPEPGPHVREPAATASPESEPAAAAAPAPAPAATQPGPEPESEDAPAPPAKPKPKPRARPKPKAKPKPAAEAKPRASRAKAAADPAEPAAAQDAGPAATNGHRDDAPPDLNATDPLVTREHP